MTWIVVAVGGALGTLARHAVNVFVTHRLARAVPLATLIVNVTGCLAIGMLAGAIARGRLDVGPVARTFLLVGVLGGFTTFSSFGLDTFTLAQSGDRLLAFSNVLGQIGLGLGAVWLGFLILSS